MKKVSKLLLGLALLQGSAYADEPKITVIDGKISITAQAVALGRFLTLFDKAMGLKSEVKPDLANQNVSVQFTDLNFNDAVRKIFQGLPYNYVVVQGKGIRVMGPAESGGSSGVASSQPFTSSSQPVINTPINNPLPQQLNPQPQPVNSNIFGAPTPGANANAPAVNPSAPMSGPGMIPPPLGTNNNPLNNNPFGGANTGGNVLPNPGVPAAPAAPPPPGVLPGAAPGATPGTIK